MNYYEYTLDVEGCLSIRGRRFQFLCRHLHMTLIFKLRTCVCSQRNGHDPNPVLRGDPGLEKLR